MRVIGAALAGFAFAAAAGALPGLLIVVAGWWYANLALAVLGVLLLLIGIVLGVALCIYRAVSKGIPDNDFGLCPGKTQPGNSNPGLSDWLADLIDEIAGRDPKKDPPLTFGDLSPAEQAGAPGHKITLRMMTTNLTLRRPYSLPFNEKIYAFRLADFERLFPARITSYLAAHCEKVDDPTGEYGDLYKFPEPENLPVIVATRMSLSFPLLFCAVPLYARDFTFASEAERAKWRKNLFSDGGLSNNFPIQFFDRMLPNSPTFGITLDDFNEKRVPEDISEALPTERSALARLVAQDHERGKRRADSRRAAARHPRVLLAAARCGDVLAGQSSKHAPRLPRPDRSCRAEVRRRRLEHHHAARARAHAGDLWRPGRHGHARRIRSRRAPLAPLPRRHGQDGPYPR